MDAEEIMVFDALKSHPLEHYTALSIWLSHNYDSSYWEPILAKAQSDVDIIRKWAEALPKGKIRSHYLEWLRYYYQYGLDDARKELREQNTRKQHDASREKYHATQNAIAEYRGEIPKPPRT